MPHCLTVSGGVPLPHCQRGCPTASLSAGVPHCLTISGGAPLPHCQRGSPLPHCQRGCPTASLSERFGFKHTPSAQLTCGILPGSVYYVCIIWTVSETRVKTHTIIAQLTCSGIIWQWLRLAVLLLRPPTEPGDLHTVQLSAGELSVLSRPHHVHGFREKLRHRTVVWLRGDAADRGRGSHGVSGRVMEGRGVTVSHGQRVTDTESRTVTDRVTDKSRTESRI